MKRILVFGIAVTLASVAAARAQTIIPGPCAAGVLPSGAQSLTCVPLQGWNGDLVVFAHGYVTPDEPLGFYNLSLPDGTPLPALVQSLGYAFATTTYRQNGLAILEGVDDLRELVSAFDAQTVPLHTYVAGASEGGLVATLLAERSPDLVSSALATCGPIGSFSRQLNYIGDFRVLFDYFFPGVIPGSAIDIPPDVIAGWSTQYAPAVAAALAANPQRAVELMRTAQAAFDPANPIPTIVNTALDVLAHDVLGTNDAVQKLGGNPYGNRYRWYFGSRNDLKLNLSVERFARSEAAAEALRAYETNGDLQVPLVTLHTTGDDLVPFGQELLYALKANPTGRGAFLPLPVFRYGHCNFSTDEVLGAFRLAVTRP